MIRVTIFGDLSHVEKRCYDNPTRVTLFSNWLESIQEPLPEGFQ